jgi:hypothetical protein
MSALDRSGEAIYAGRVSPCDGFTEIMVHSDLEATVRIPLLSMAVVVLAALTGCHLVDQTDFRPKPPAPPPAPPPVPDPETRAPLVTIDYAKANPDYTTALTAAIHAVESKRPGVLYDVVAVAGDSNAALAARPHAAEVMIAIEADGVIPARVQLGLRIDPGRKIPQVRVYLR